MKKTFQKSAREYAYSVINSFGRNGVPNGISDIKEMLAIAFENGAEWQAKRSPWISVDKKMPPLGQKVIHMNVNTGEINVGQVNKVGIFVLGYTYVGEVEVTHWMSIPSSEEIIEINKDALKRIKEKGD